MNEKPIAAGKSSFDLIDPEKVFAALRLESGMTVADLACGAGNYALAIAGRLQGKGTVHALDLWSEGIATLREEAERSGVANIRAAVADVTARLPLADASVDLCLLATVLHDLAEEGKEAGVLREAARVLRPGGKLAVIEFRKIDGPPGPPAAIRLAPEETEAMVVPFGFRVEETIEVGPFNYLMNFIKT